MYDYHNAQLDVAKELFSKTLFDSAISLLEPEIEYLEQTQDYNLLSEYLKVIISSYINKSDIVSIEPLLEKLNNALLASSHPSLKVNYPYHVGYFFMLSGDTDQAIEMLEKALIYINSNVKHPVYMDICISLCYWYTIQNKLDRAIYYRDKIQHLIPPLKHASPQIYSYFLNVSARCFLMQNNFAAAYDTLMKIWQHPVLIKDKKTFMITSFQLGEYYAQMNEPQLADEFFQKSWTAAEGMNNLLFINFALTHIIAGYEKIGDFEKALAFSKIKTANLESKTLLQQQERLHLFALQAKLDALQLRAYKDKLTQLYNRHYFEETLEDWLRFARDHHTPICCALFDLDDFKEKNDRYGHLAGDYVLRTIGKIVKKYEVPYELFAARYGGDEFIIIGKNKEKFQHTIEQIFKKIQTLEIPYGDDVITCSISLGAVLLDNVDTFTIADIIHKADEQLYSVKKSGKNALKVI